MAMTPFSSLLFFTFIFITTPFHYTVFASPQSSSQTNLNKNPDLKSNSKADNVGVVSQDLWCVAKNNAEDAALQSALDWACGPGRADCSPIQKGGPCYDSDNFQATASFAFNDYFLKNGKTQDSCSFGNTAALSSLDPSHGTCKFPSSTLVANSSFTGSIIGMGPSGADMSGSQLVGVWDRVIITVALVFATGLVFQ